MEPSLRAEMLWLNGRSLWSAKECDDKWKGFPHQRSRLEPWLCSGMLWLNEIKGSPEKEASHSRFASFTFPPKKRTKNYTKLVYVSADGYEGLLMTVLLGVYSLKGHALLHDRRTHICPKLALCWPTSLNYFVTSEEQSIIILDIAHSPCHPVSSNFRWRDLNLIIEIFLMCSITGQSTFLQPQNLSEL